MSPISLNLFIVISLHFLLWILIFSFCLAAHIPYFYSFNVCSWNVMPIYLKVWTWNTWTKGLEATQLCFTPNLHITSGQQCGSFRQNASLPCVCTDIYRLPFWDQFPFFLKYIILDVSFHKGLSVASSWRFPLLWGRRVLRQFCGHTIIVQQFSLNTGNKYHFCFHMLCPGMDFFVCLSY